MTKQLLTFSYSQPFHHPRLVPLITEQIKIGLTNLTLLTPSPYRLITGQIEVDLINPEDGFEKNNSQLPINLVAASLYLTLILYTDKKSESGARVLQLK